MSLPSRHEAGGRGPPGIRRGRIGPVLAGVWTLFASAPAPALVISEIHYHPPPGEDDLEFIEVANDTSTPDDISGYAFVEGISYQFPPGTILPARGFLVVCANADALRARFGISNALGDYAGRLDNGGERVTLANHAGIAVASLRYRDGGKWPVGPDGMGHTLAIRDVHLDPGEPESWTQSAELGGTPGLPNFPDGGATVEEVVIIDRGATWRYAKGTAPFSTPADAWVAPAYVDVGWLSGPSGFGYGDGDDATVLADMEGGYGAVACRKSFVLSEAEISAGELFLGIDFDDGFAAYLNGVEVARSNCGSSGVVPTYSDLATASREAGVEELFPVPKSLLVAGTNVIAVSGHNLSVTSSDFSLIPRLLLRRPSTGGPGIVEEDLVGPGESWRVWKGTGPFSSPTSAWHEPSFPDGLWGAASSGFGFRVVGGAFIAYGIPQGLIGNQEFGGSLGMDFDVRDEVVVRRLGVFDSGSDGLQRSITARLYDRSTRSEVASLSFTAASPGLLVGGSRFKDLPAPVSLPPGFQGTIVAEGYGPGEPNGNQGGGPFVPPPTLDDGEGAIAFVGAARYGMAAGQFPDTQDGGPANRYAAGTFEFAIPGVPGGVIDAPPGVATLLGDMPGGYTSLAARKTFTLGSDDLSAGGEVSLAIDWDDGFAAWLNGVEVARSNLGTSGEEPAWNGVATSARDSTGEEFFSVPPDLLLEGENVLAIVALNAAVDDPDFRLIPRLVRRRLVDSGAASSGIVINELFRGAVAGAGWVELYNPSALPVDLGGHLLSDGPENLAPFALPAGTTIEPRGFLAITAAASGLVLSTPEVQVFLVSPGGIMVAAATFEREPPPGATPGGWSEARYPDGGPLDWVTLTPTPGAPNRVPRVENIVLNEIFYHPPEDRTGEFIELHNRGATPVDISGYRFDDGIRFTVPEGTVVGPGGYLVVSDDPLAILRQHGVEALGPWEGTLSDRGEAIRLVDRSGNPVDKVRYHDGGRWSPWADGGGSSLELIDPFQDNAFASAWEASDETAKAQWEELSFHVDDYQPASESELALYLIADGVCLVDDISIRRAGGTNLVPNPGFETSTAPWLIGGTHIRSGRATHDSHTGGACLEVVATGSGDTLVNRIETDTSPPMTAGPYDVSLWARWERGTSLMVVHGPYHPGPYRTTPCFTCGGTAPNWSGNSMAQALRMTVPLALGTPGAENGARRRLREATGSDNLGPVIADVGSVPPSPEPGIPAIVLASASDADGVESVEVLYRTGSADGAFQSAPLLDDGLHGDGAEGDGVYGGTIPPYPALTKVVFFLEATDTRGASRRFPVEAPDRILVYQVQGALDAQRDTYRVVLDDARQRELETRQLHSDDLIEGTLVFDDRRIVYDIGTRYRGSPWGRPGRSSFRIRLPEDDRFRSTRKSINLTGSGAGLSEAAGLFFVGRTAVPGRPAPAADYRFVQAYWNGSGLGWKADLEPMDRDFLEKWYGEEAEGPLLKANGRFVFTDAGGLIGQTGWEGGSLVDRGEDPENYRGYFAHGVNETRDDWGPLFRLVQALDPTRTPDAAFAEVVAGTVDLDAFFRVLAARMLQDDCDALGVNNGHNGYIVHDSRTGLWGMLPFDLECTFSNPNRNLFTSPDPGVQRLLTHPATRREYLRVLTEFADGYWSPTAAGPWLEEIQRATGFGVSGMQAYVSAGNAAVRAAVGAFESTPLRILTNGGSDLSTATPTVTLAGEAPIRTDAIVRARNGGPFRLLFPAWSTPVRWSAEVRLPEATNDFRFIALSSVSEILGEVTIRVTTSVASRIEVTDWSPESGPIWGGTPVTYVGSGFAAGLRVLFGGIEAPEVVIQGPGSVMVTTPPYPPPLPAGGAVPVEFVIDDERVVVPDGFRYLLEGGFVRGDVNGDAAVDVSDAVRLLLRLYLGAPPFPCDRSADFDDGGTLAVSDAIGILSYLFRGGPHPAAPFPSCGEDPTPDDLPCDSFPPCGG